MAGSRTLKTLVGLGVLVAVAAGAAFMFWPQIFAAIEEDAIWSEKADHWHLYSSGKTLPGTPELQDLQGRLAAQGAKLGDPVLVRIFKREFELEVWLKHDGRFQRFATYPICMWSVGLGPKVREGDKQAPEGFYTVDGSQLNPNSNYHRSFNLGFPNAFDRAHGRTGSLLMVHGDCRSIGCYAMTDPVIDEIWQGRPRQLPGSRLPIPHDGQEHGVARARARSGLLATAQARPRPVRADADPAGRKCVSRPLLIPDGK